MIIIMIIIHQIFPLVRDWWNHDTSGRYQPIMPGHSQQPPSGEQTLKWSVFLQFTDEEIRKLVEKAVPESTKKMTCFASCVALLFCFAPLLSL